MLSELLRIGYLPEVWTPDQQTRQLRGLCARPSLLVSDCVRLKHRIHGVLAKCLVPRPDEIFDVKGRRWLTSLELPEWAQRQIQSDLRLLTLAEMRKTFRICSWLYLLLLISPSSSLEETNATDEEWSD